MKDETGIEGDVWAVDVSITCRKQKQNLFENNPRKG